MSLYQRNGIWWIYLVAPNGKKVRQSTELTDKQQAQQKHDLLKAQLIKAPQSVLIGNHTWQEASHRWLAESKHKATWHKDKMVLHWFGEQIGQTKLRDITADLIAEAMRVKAEEVQPATINRYLQIIRAVLRKAEREWNWLDKAPYIRLRKLDTKRVRYITTKQAMTLLSELPKHQRCITEFALLTGLRQRNVLDLQWSQVDMRNAVAWIHPDQSKTRKAIAVPLNQRAIAILEQVKGQHETHVFTYKSAPIQQVNTKAWKNALKRAGIENFRWHDLRHTWATWHIQNGTPTHALQELGGWSSYEMVRRYAHLSAAHLLDYSKNAMLEC
jgi:integrase